VLPSCALAHTSASLAIVGAMRVCVIGTTLSRVTHTGGGTFFLGLVRALSTLEDVDVILVGPRSEQAELARRMAVEVVGVRDWSGPSRIARDLYRLRRVVHGFGPDVVHFPFEWAPRFDQPVVDTIHNVAWMHPHSRKSVGLRGAALRALARGTKHNARVHVAVSAQAAELWSKVVGLPTSSVTVIPEAVALEDACVSELTKWALPRPRPFVLGMTGPDRHKNRQLLIDSLQVARQDGMALDVVVVGADSGDVPSWMYAVPSCPRSVLLAYMRHAKAVVYPSAVESFGLPAYESLSVGTPCLVLAGTPMAEALRDRVVAVAADAHEIANAVRRLLTLTRPVPPLESVTPTAVGQQWRAVYDRAVAP
jgi:glycosyltransferase involved in cell wall biosynthesis